MSKTVFIRRNGNPTRLNDDMYEDATTKIGARFKGKSPMSAFSDSEKETEYRYLSDAAGIDNNASDFSKLRNRFWNEFTVSVPGDEKGLSLNIAVDKDGIPENWDDYVTYKYIMKCKEVAANKTEAEASPHKLFYFYDPEEQKKTEYGRMQQRRKVSQYFNEVTSGKDAAKRKLDHILRIMGINPDTFKDRESRELALDKELQKEGSATLFIESYEDGDLEQKAMVYELVQYGILQRSGNDFYDGSELLGTLKQVVAKLKNKSESDRYIRYTQALKEAKK